MIAADSFAGQRVALFGLGGSGIATAKSLIAGYADVLAFDDNPASVDAATAEGIETGDLRETDWSRFAALVLSPGVPLTHPKPHWTVDLAHAASIPIIGDIEIFSRQHAGSKAPFIAITGTNGKSTTTALIAHMLSHAGRDTQMGGNIGKAILTLQPPADDRHYVVECSSYQIDLAPSLAPDIGILLNLSPDHLDRHGDMQHYAAIKQRLVEKAATAIVGVDDDWCNAIADRLETNGRKVLRISKDRHLHDGYFLSGDKLVHAVDGEQTAIASLEGIGSLRGAHNAQNALAATAACVICGMDPSEIQAALTSFPGLVHRMEQVGRIGTTLFVNDSKATNSEAAATALASFGNIYWIAGGLQKDGGFEALRPHLAHIEKAYLIGEAAPSLSSFLGETVRYEISGTMQQAVNHAARDSARDISGESVVLLSPACASFDQFRNFEVRGEAFKMAVKALDGFEPFGSIG
ncbi:MAG: UDP-N-acetylmuramoyl-L-alanine--D-glutamate ligase [Rhizobiaceae bacterium]